MDALYFDIVTSVPHTTESRVYGRRDYPARLLQVALLDSAGELLYKSYVQPTDLDWEETSDGTYLNTSHFKRKRFPTQEQVVEQIQPFLKGWEVIVYGLHEKWPFVIPFISPVRQKSCSKTMSGLFASRSGFVDHTGRRDFNQAVGHILFVPEYSSDTSLLDAESVAKGSRALWQYGTNPTYRDEVETRREYYLINPIVETIIQRERMPLYQQRARIHQQLEKRICQGAHILLPSPERQQLAKESADSFCQHLTGHSLYWWERYGSWLDAPTVGSPIPTHLTPDYEIKRLGHLNPVAKVDNRVHHLAGNRFTFLFDLSQYKPGQDYVPIVKYWSTGTCSASQLKKQFKLKDSQIKALAPVAYTHGLWGEYFLYTWPTGIAT